ncbi:peptidoglycan-binding domain-containing protein [Renibacterium salmoninarum]|uniref:peptidoglycan-binding domain-containing protein n=1 Tax=Renibacterium salmoninarum TaxID=1646 RepID=UPI002687A51B
MFSSLRFHPRILTFFLAFLIAVPTVGLLPGLPSASAAPAAVSSLYDSSCPNLIEKGQNSGCVTRLQQLLNNNGAKRTVDGGFGDGTFTAVKSYQSAHGLSADGIVGPNTKGALEGGPAPSDSAFLARSLITQIKQCRAKRSAVGAAAPFLIAGAVGAVLSQGLP